MAEVPNSDGGNAHQAVFRANPKAPAPSSNVDSDDEDDGASRSDSGEDHLHSDSRTAGADTSDTDMAHFRLKMNHAREAGASSPSNRPPKWRWAK